MLTGFVSKKRPLAKFIIMLLIGLILLIEFVTMFGNYSARGSHENAAISFSFLATAILLGLLLFCMLSNREDHARGLGFAYLAYYVISTFLSIGNPFYSLHAGNHGTFVAAAVFAILSNTILIAIVVLSLISFLNGKNFDKAIDILLIAFLGVNFLAMIMLMSGYAVSKYYTWPSYFSAIESKLFMPAFVTLGFLYLTSTSEVQVEDEPYEDTVVEDK